MRRKEEKEGGNGSKIKGSGIWGAFQIVLKGQSKWHLTKQARQFNTQPGNALLLRPSDVRGCQDFG